VPQWREEEGERTKASSGWSTECADNKLARGRLLTEADLRSGCKKEKKEFKGTGQSNAGVDATWGRPFFSSTKTDPEGRKSLKGDANHQLKERKTARWAGLPRYKEWGDGQRRIQGKKVMR